MATFQGSKSEFIKFFKSRYLSEIITMQLEENKSPNRTCVFCGSKSVYTTTFANNYNSEQIINLLLDKYFNNDNYLVNLEKFKKEFISYHLPKNKYMRSFCYDCFKKYKEGLIDESVLSKKS